MARIDTELSCPSCGGGIQLEFRYTKMVVCPYCGQTNYLNVEDQLSPDGPKQVPLVDYGSKLKVGAKGNLSDTPFKVLGRLRYEYPKGFWDEWLVRLGDDRDTLYWLEEDEGEFMLYKKRELSDLAPAYEEVIVGETIELGEFQVFVSEKNKAVVKGGEGELPFQLLPDEQADFVDGFTEGKVMSIEYLPEGEKEVNLGVPVPFSKLEVEN